MMQATPATDRRAVPENNSVDQAVLTLVEELQANYDGTLVSFSVDYQTNGVFPYRVFIREEGLPLIGEALADSGTDDRP